jgi:hypothetical protein
MGGDLSFWNSRVDGRADPGGLNMTLTLCWFFQKEKARPFFPFEPSAICLVKLIFAYSRPISTPSNGLGRGSEDNSQLKRA